MQGKSTRNWHLSVVFCWLSVLGILGVGLLGCGPTRTFPPSPGGFFGPGGGFFPGEDAGPSPEPLRASWSCGGKLDFGTVRYGSSVTMECTLVNVGDTPFTLEAFSFLAGEGSKNTFLFLDEKLLPLEVPSGLSEGVTLRFQYKPTNSVFLEDSSSFQLRLYQRKIASLETPTLEVVGRVVPNSLPQIGVFPLYPPCSSSEDCKAIDPSFTCVEDDILLKNVCRTSSRASFPLMRFPFTPVGGSSTRSLVIENLSTSPLLIKKMEFLSKINSQAYKLNSQVKLPLGLPPRQSLTLEFLYTPNQFASLKNSFLIDSNDVKNPRISVSFEVETGKCEFAFEKKQILFSKPSTQSIRLVNQGKESCFAGGVALGSGHGGAFQLSSVPTEMKLIKPGEALEFELQFSPKTTGSFQSSVTVDLQGTELTYVSIKVEGTAQCPCECELVVTPQAVDFGVVAHGQTGASPIKISNVGLATCEVTTMQLQTVEPTPSQSFALPSSDMLKLPLAIGVGESASFELFFSPPKGTLRAEGKLLLQTNQLKQPEIQVPLSGQATESCLSIQPGNSVALGDAKESCATPKRLIEIAHSGSPVCPPSFRVSVVEFASMENNKEFLLEGAPTNEISVRVGSPLKLLVSYRPTDVGFDSTTLELKTSIVGQSRVLIALEGKGVSLDEQIDGFQQSANASLARYVLSRPAEDATISVKVDGQTATRDAVNGWIFDAKDNSIVFSASQIPPANAVIEVQYKAICKP